MIEYKVRHRCVKPDRMFLTLDDAQGHYLEQRYRGCCDVAVLWREVSTWLPIPMDDE